MILENVGAKLLAFSTEGLTDLRSDTKVDSHSPYLISVLGQERFILNIKILRRLDQNTVLETTVTKHDSSGDIRVLNHDALYIKLST